MNIIDTPWDIDDYKNEEFLNFVDNQNPSEGLRLKDDYTKFFYAKWGYELTNDIRLILDSSSQRMMVIAPAGSGKTTTMTAKTFIELYFNKSLSARRVMFLVYNKGNPDDIRNRYKKLCDELLKVDPSRPQMAEIIGRNMPGSDFECRTFHSLANLILKENKDSSVLRGMVPTRDKEKMRKCYERGVVNLINELSKGDTKTKRSASGYLNSLRHKLILKFNEFISVYNQHIESLISTKELIKTEVYKDLDIPGEYYDKLFISYRRELFRNKVYTDTDTLDVVLKLLRKKPEIAQKYKDRFDMVILDEVQDLSPIMLRIVKEILRPDTKLIAVGDDDQRIYEFRVPGGDQSQVFQKLFTSKDLVPKVYSIMRNRRCPNNVVEFSKDLIGNLKDGRFDKRIIAARSDIGDISYFEMDSRFSMYTKIVKDIITKKAKNPDAECCICYRNNADGEVLTDIMYNANMEFHVSSRFKPLRSAFMNAVIDTLDLLYYSNQESYLLKLYECTPLRKADVQALLEYDSYERRFIGGRKSLETLELGRFDNPRVTESIDKLKSLTVRVRKEPLSSYISQVIELVSNHCYFEQSYDKNYFESSTYKYFNKDINYYEFRPRYERDIRVCDERLLLGKGTKMSTIHGLKGLEFDHIYILPLPSTNIKEDDKKRIIANVSMDGSDDIDVESVFKQMRDETLEYRLLYVLITRTKDSVTIFGNSKDKNEFYELCKKYDASGVYYREAKSVFEFPSTKSTFNVLSGSSGVTTTEIVKLTMPTKKDIQEKVMKEINFTEIKDDKIIAPIHRDDGKGSEVQRDSATKLINTNISTGVTDNKWTRNKSFASRFRRK